MNLSSLHSPSTANQSCMYMKLKHLEALYNVELGDSQSQTQLRTSTRYTYSDWKIAFSRRARTCESLWSSCLFIAYIFIFFFCGVLLCAASFKIFRFRLLTMKTSACFPKLLYCSWWYCFSTVVGELSCTVEEARNEEKKVFMFAIPGF